MTKRKLIVWLIAAIAAIAVLPLVFGQCAVCVIGW